MIDHDRNVLKRIVMGNESWCFMYNQEKNVRVQLS
jgi:hypothetical protein